MARPKRVMTLAGLVLSVLVGVFLGTSAFTFHIAEGASYMSNDPTACVNCHIMREQYDSWQKSSHHAFATCNDCHVPHSLLAKLVTKADNGYRHSWGFTFQDFHEPIQLHERSRAVIESNCLHCHSPIMSEIIGAHGNGDDPLSCIRCHGAVGHGAHR